MVVFAAVVHFALMSSGAMAGSLEVLNRNIDRQSSMGEVVLPADPSTSHIDAVCRKGSPSPSINRATLHERKLTVVFGAFGRLLKSDSGRLKPREGDLAQIRAILASVRQTGLLDGQFASQVDFQVVVSCGTGWGRVPKDIDCSEVAAQATVSVRHLLNVHVHVFHGNAYEFPALHWMWQLGCSSDPEQLFLYFHSKGTRYPSASRD